MFEPEYAAKLKSCGINFLDSASEVMPVAMIYAGKPPYSTKAGRLRRRARKVLTKARPEHHALFVVGLHQRPGQRLGLRVVMGYSGDINIARQRAIEANQKSQQIQALIPPSGATLFFDTMAIPKDAEARGRMRTSSSTTSCAPRCTPR